MKKTYIHPAISSTNYANDIMDNPIVHNSVGTGPQYAPERNQQEEEELMEDEEMIGLLKNLEEGDADNTNNLW